MSASALSIGAFGENVRAIQNALQKLRYSIVPSEIQRGFFGPATRQAVLQFQKQNGLPTTGKVDQDTTAALDQALSAAGSTLDLQSTSTNIPQQASAPGSQANPPPPSQMAVASSVEKNGSSTDGAGVITPNAATSTSSGSGSAPSISSTSAKPASKVIGARPQSTAKATSTSKPSTIKPTAIKISATDLARPVVTVLSDRSLTPATKSALSESLNTALKSQLISTATNAGSSELATALEALPAVDVAAASGLSLRDFVAKTLKLPANSAEKTVIETEIAKLSTATTVGGLLGLNSNLQSNSVLAPVLKQASLAMLLQTSPGTASNSALIDDFIGKYSDYRGSIADFWIQLSADPKFKAIVPELQLSLQLGDLTLGNSALVSVLRAQFPKITSPRDLSTLTAADWEQLITQQNISVPGSISGATPAEKASNYSSSIMDALRSAFPGAYFAQDFQAATSASKDPIDTAVSTFLNNASDFDILKSNLNTYLAQHADSAFSGIDATLQKAVTTRLGALQRVGKVTTDFSTTSILISAGFSSAFDIARTSRSFFLQTFGPQLGSSSSAEAVFSKAQQVTARASALHINLRQALTSNLPRAIGSMSRVVSDQISSSGLLPTWQTLFGSTSSCACDDCLSVYSAAAYFVDLLDFLRTSPWKNSAGHTAYDALLARRPDLPYLKLNCVNTNTELPYVDLVNEILESFVVINNGQLDPTSTAHNTPKDATAGELSVNPEYTNADAYNKYLNAVVYLPSPPFDRWLTTARTYLNFLGASLYDVMSACQTGADPTDFTKGNPTGIAIACEYLGISEAECLILTGRDFSGQPSSLVSPLWEYYGFSGPAIPPQHGKSWEELIAQVETFLQRTGIAYDDLIALLKTRALNPGLTIVLSAPDGAGACDLTQTTILDLSVPSVLPDSGNGRHHTGPPIRPTPAYILQDEPTLSLMHRFIRLWKKLGWAICDLDKTMTALGATDIDQQLLVSLAAMRQLQANLNLPLLQVLTFWSDLDADGKSCLYLNLFQNKTVLNPPDPAFQLTYEAHLAAMPSLQFPSPLFPNLNYEATSATTGMLSASTPISQDEFTRLLCASSEPDYQHAISQLVTEQVKNLTGGVGPVSPPVASLPAIVLPGFVSWTPGGTLSVSAPMSPGQLDQLLALSTDPTYQATVNHIYAASNAGGPPPYSDYLLGPLPPLPGLAYDPVAQRITFTGPMSDDERALFNFSSDPAYQTAVDSLYELRTLPLSGTNVLGTDVLDKPNPGLSNHLPTILAAFGISAQDVATLRNYTELADPPSPQPPTPITLHNLSTLARFIFLANGLGISINDLISLIQLIGFDPFGDQNPLVTLLFVQSARDVLASSFSIAQLNYLYRNDYDPNSAIAPMSSNITSLLASLQIALAGIVNADAIVSDPKGELLAKNLAVLLGNNLATAAIGLITRTTVYSAALAQPPTGLDLANLPAGSGLLVYDIAAKQLRFTGPMSTVTETTLLKLSSDANYRAAIQNLYQQPRDFITANFASFLTASDPDGVNDAIKELIDSSPSRAVAETIAWITSRLMPYLQQIQSKSLITQTLCDNLDLDPKIGGLLLNSILKSQVYPGQLNTWAISDFLALVGDGLTAKYYVGANPAGTAALTRIDPTINFNWGYGTPDASTLAITGAPFSVKWTGWLMPQFSETYSFFVMGGDGVRLSVNGTPLIDLWGKDRMPTEALPPGSPPNSIALAAGQLYSIELDWYDQSAPAVIQLSWSSPSTPKAIIPQTQLFSGAVIQSLTPIISSYTLLYNANLFISTFPLTYADVDYFSNNGKAFQGIDPIEPSNAASFVDFDLNNLPLSPPTPGPFARALFNQWQRLNAIVNLRKTMPGGDSGLLAIFAQASAGQVTTSLSLDYIPAGSSAPGPDPLTTAIAQATGWNPVDLVFLAGSHGFSLTYGDFTNEIGTSGVGLIGLQICERLLQRLGISAQQLFSWSALGPDSSNTQLTAEQAIAADIQNTVKAKYTDATWVTVGKPLNDAIRQASTNALIAYILAGAGGYLPNASNWNMVAPNDGGPITTADQLYEYFLIDVQMSTCMLTSRIVQASAAIQLFVQRCLMNLEYRQGTDKWSISPVAINTIIWEWLQNFRVWQANVEVLYHPENYIVPTLRDDMTPFFQDLQNSLLQSQIDSDTLEQAYLTYLTALDEVARLDIRGIYWQLDPSSGPLPDGTPDATNDILHVFGRTQSSQYSYYYRRLLNCSRYGTTTGGAMWTPWEQVNVSIQADHLVPVVWEHRLYLFWPTFSQSADPTTQGTIPSPNAGGSYTPPPPVMDLAITLHWSEYWQGGWSQPRSSDPLVFQDFSDNYGPITTLGGTTFDTSRFYFNSAISGDSLAIKVSAWNGWGSHDPNVQIQIGHFLFSHCGSDPSSQTDRSFVAVLYPLSTQTPPPTGTLPTGTNASAYFNSILGGTGSWQNPIPYVDANGLTLQIALTAPFLTAEQFFGSVVALGVTPTLLQPWRLMLPQQFFGCFGTLMPAGGQFGAGPVAVSDGPNMVIPGQPFFYQDNLRTYFVTETFNLGNPSVSDANLESQVYSRDTLNTQSSITNGNYDRTVTLAANEVNTPTPAIKPGTNTASASPSLMISPAAGPTSQSSLAGLSGIQFSTFFHPFGCSFIESVNQYGLSSFLTLGTQASTNDSGVIGGFLLYSQAGLTPGITPGILIAQGELYETTTPPQLDRVPSGPGPYYLFFTCAPTDGITPPRSFYYETSISPRSQGDAFIGGVAPVNGGVLAAPQSTMFYQNYQPWITVSPYSYPLENVDFSSDGAYSIYNWELFFHIPLLIATQLSANQQFADAQKWFQYIFNPTNSSTDPIPQRYWNFLPFYECAPWDNLIGQCQLLMGQGPSLCGQNAVDQVDVWATKPFNPFAIARMRTIAFRMKVVMAYLDNLIAWGDNLFAQNTRESINEATQIYVLANEILGPRPIEIPQQGPTQDYSYNDLATLFGIDALGNAIVLIENDLPYLTGYSSFSSPGPGALLSMSNIVPYFCLPSNDTLNGYWDTVDDRLYKIRHCMNIQGVVQQLPLFAPPISPALLVAAEAEGVDISSVLSNINAGTPFYRFTPILQKAFELCTEVRSFGAALLAALEKQDAEGLATLRANQELSLLQAMQQMKELAVQEAESTQAGLQASLTTATDRQNYYLGLHKVGLISDETQQLTLLQSAASSIGDGTLLLGEAAIQAGVPAGSFGAWGMSTPGASITFGGENLVGSANAMAGQKSNDANLHSNNSSQHGLSAGFSRRDAEWQFQAGQASDEMAQIEAQLSAANLRIQIAQQDQNNLNLQIQNAQAMLDFLTGKYTNQQLYSWMIDQISTVYFQCYQMAYNLAIQAEAAFRFERGLATSSYIQFGYWDSLKKGLLSGERLYADLKRLEIAYLQTDVREFEISKSISLLLFDPWALIALKETGICTINVPEAYFDFDYPGHYFRRLKTVNLAIPSVTGPYTSVNCTLTLLNSKLRVDNNATSTTDYASDAHFLTNYAVTQSIATSTAQNDHGLFEVNFHDERYLPFEGAGVISTWQIELPLDCNAFDFESISDVVLNLKYTSRYGGDILKGFARQAASLPTPPTQSLQGPSNPTYFPVQNDLRRLFSLKHEFPQEWNKLLHPADTATSQSMQIALGRERFPFLYRQRKNLQISEVEFFLLLRPQFQSDYAGGPTVQLGPSTPSNQNPSAAPQAPSPPVSVTLRPSSPSVSSSVSILGYGSMPFQTPPSVPVKSPLLWQLIVSSSSIPAGLQNSVSVNDANYIHLNPAALGDVLILCHYSVSKT